MNTIPLPTTIDIKENKENLNQAQIIIEPCFPGYGTTLGNSLRRVLLSSLYGAAVIAVKIKGATHEFSTLPNVKEDILEIILNLKSLRIQSDKKIEEPVILELKAKGEKVIKGKDIETVSGVRIVNPDLKIATLTDAKASLEMKLWIGGGKGYSTSEEIGKKDFEVGVIICDAIFTPLKKVSMDVENIRVGDRTDYDKLILNIETDGTIDPKEALEKSANILVEQFSFIAKGESVKEEIKPEVEAIEKIKEEKIEATEEKEDKKKKVKSKK